MDYQVQYSVSCHLPRGSKLRWREDMGGVLPNARGLRIGWRLQPTGLQIAIKLPTTMLDTRLTDYWSLYKITGVGRDNSNVFPAVFYYSSWMTLHSVVLMQ